MALELATAIVRVQFDRNNLRSEIKKARKEIEKGLSGIKIKVQVDFDYRQAAAAGKKAGKAAGDAASGQFRAAIGGGPVGFIGSRSRTQPTTYIGPYGRPIPMGGAGQQRLAGPSQQRALPAPGVRGYLPYYPADQRTFNVPPGGYGAAERARRSAENARLDARDAARRRRHERKIEESSDRALRQAQRASARWERGASPDRGFWGGMFGGGGQGGGRSLGGLPRFGGARAFATGAAFQLAPSFAVAGSFGGAPGLAGAAIAAGLAGSTKSRMGFQKEFGMVDILQRMEGASPEQIRELQKMARQSSSRSVFGPTQAAGAMRSMTQAGMSASSISQALPHVENLAVADGFIELNDAARITAKAMNQFKMEAGETERIVDALSISANASETSVENIGTALGYVGADARLAGETIESTAAAIATLSQNAMDASRAGTGFRQLIRSLGKTRTREAIKDQMGVDISGMTPLEAVSAMAGPFSRMSADRQAAFASTYLPANSASAFKILAENQDYLRGVGNRIQNEKGSTSFVADKRANELWAKVERLGGAFQRLGIVIGGLIEGPLGSMIDYLTSFINLLSVTLESLESMIKGFMDNLRVLDLLPGGSLMRALVARKTSNINDMLPLPGQVAGIPRVPRVNSTIIGDGFEDGISKDESSGTAIVDAENVWEHIQRGLLEQDYDKQIADNTKRIADNTDPKKPAGSAGQAKNPWAINRNPWAINRNPWAINRNPLGKKRGEKDDKLPTQKNRRDALYEDMAFLGIQSFGPGPTNPRDLWDRDQDTAKRYRESAATARGKYEELNEEDKMGRRGDALRREWHVWESMASRLEDKRLNPNYSGRNRVYRDATRKEIDDALKKYHAEVAINESKGLPPPEHPEDYFKRRSEQRREDERNRYKSIRSKEEEEEIRNNQEKRRRKGWTAKDATLDEFGKNFQYRESPGTITPDIESAKKFLEFIRSGGKNKGFGIQDSFMDWWGEKYPNNIDGITNSNRENPTETLETIDSSIGEAIGVLEEIASNTKNMSFSWS